MANRLKVLISTYACEPGRGSEMGKGWNYVTQMSKHHQIWAITRNDRQPIIEKELAQNPVPNVTWIYYDLPHWLVFWRKGQRGLRVHYYMWQIGAYFAARKHHKQVNFDVVHHVSHAKYWNPSFMAWIKAPFVWGPVGGGETTPGPFQRMLERGGKTREYLRNIVLFVGHHDPFVGMTARRSALVLATTNESAERIRQLGAKTIRTFSAMALPDEDLTVLNALPVRQGQPLRFVSIGRVLDWKGFHLGLAAFAEFLRDHPESEYWIIGDGPQIPGLKAQIEKAGITDSVRFFGKIPRGDVLKNLGECDVLVHPSLHDSGGWVCVEAMAAGRPVICLDLGGPGVIVSDKAGFKIPAHTPEQAIADISEAMRQLADVEGLKDQMGQAGRQYVAEAFSWDVKGELVSDIYHEVYDAAQRQERDL